MRKYLSAIFLGFLFMSSPVYCQEDDCKNNKDITIRMIKTKDGGTIFGDVISENDSVKLNTNSFGIVSIPINQIKQNSEVQCSQIRDGEYWIENPNYSSYIMMPSAIPMKKFDMYYRNSMLLFNSFGVGITNNISVNVSFEFIGLFESRPFVSVLPKVGFAVGDKWNLGLGFLYLWTRDFYFNEFYMFDDNAGFVMPLATYGSKDNNFSIGGGVNLLSKSDDSEKYIVTLSGIKRISKRISLITDNFIRTDSELEYVFSYGARFIARRMSVDFVLLNHENLNRDIPIGIPLISFMIEIGK